MVSPGRKSKRVLWIIAALTAILTVAVVAFFRIATDVTRSEYQIYVWEHVLRPYMLQYVDGSTTDTVTRNLIVMESSNAICFIAKEYIPKYGCPVLIWDKQTKRATRWSLKSAWSQGPESDDMP